MRICSMTATFGKLEHSTLTLQPGLNVITAPNEWGKSTWCAFLIAMLYGLDTRARTTGRNLADKEKYRPWSGSPMEGRIELLWRGRAITIQRRTTGRVPMGEFRAYETDTGLPVPELTAENCGVTLLGVERSVYRRSGFIRQEELPVTQDEALRRRLNGLVTTGEESGTADLLAEKLRELKNRCRHNRTGLIPQAEAALAALVQKQAQYNELQDRQTQLERELQAEQIRIAALEAQLREQQTATIQKGHGFHRIWPGVLAVAAAMVMVALYPSLWTGLLLAMVLGLLVWALRRWPAPEREKEVLADRQTETMNQLTKARNRQLQLQRELGQCQGQLQGLGELNPTHQATLKQRLDRLYETEAALSLAMETLDTARQELQRRFAPEISGKAQKLFSQLTEGRYEALALDQELGLSARARGEDTMRSPLWRSSGTVDQLYLALRLAVAEALTPEAPLVLDDVFVRFDAQRRETACSVLRQYAKSAQVILFTSAALSK